MTSGRYDTMTTEKTQLEAELEGAITQWRVEQTRSAVLSAGVADGSLVPAVDLERGLLRVAVDLRRSLEIRCNRFGAAITAAGTTEQVLDILRESDHELIEMAQQPLRLGSDPDLGLAASIEDLQELARDAEEEPIR